MEGVIIKTLLFVLPVLQFRVVQVLQVNHDRLLAPILPFLLQYLQTIIKTILY